MARASLFVCICQQYVFKMLYGLPADCTSQLVWTVICFVTKICQSPKFLRIQTFGFHSIAHFYFYSPVEGSALVELFIFQSFQIFQILHTGNLFGGAGLPHSSAYRPRAPEDDPFENLGGGQTECILHGALLS